MKLKVEYDYCGSTFGSLIDEVIEKALKPLGLEMWASGYNLKTNIRDLAFYVKENKKESIK